MTQSGRLKRWTPRFFVLENGFLSHYEKKSLVGTKKGKVRLRYFGNGCSIGSGNGDGSGNGISMAVVNYSGNCSGSGSGRW